NEMQARTDLAPPAGGAGLPIVDRNGDGIPDFNDGIGRIEITGANGSSSLTMVGGDFKRMGFYPTTTEGMLNDFEQAGFGYDLTTAQPPTVIGLPEGSGSL